MRLKHPLLLQGAFCPATESRRLHTTGRERVKNSPEPSVEQPGSAAPSPGARLACQSPAPAARRLGHRPTWEGPD